MKKGEGFGTASHQRFIDNFSRSSVIEDHGLTLECRTILRCIASSKRSSMRLSSPICARIHSLHLMRKQSNTLSRLGES